tara:strand:+ start:566 stop:1843 length:1278 start_codon:yes stop_codon:yes gene_type:complete
MSDLLNKKICILGLGYVGLPLACAFGEKFATIGYDINSIRCAELLKLYDRTGELSSKELASAKLLKITNKFEDIHSCNIYIITVPTPVDSHKKPNLNPIRNASKLVSSALSYGDIVIYESTVYPGATEQFCVPLLEIGSNLRYNKDFFCGYSPERINPGDKERQIKNIVKVTSGSTEEIANVVDELYSEIIIAGTYKAKSIQVAEAAKVIENTQRDINISLINELSKIFNRLGIDTQEVLEAAGTKWNFLHFKPGLVGGHCIGVDPYYLTHKAQEVGYEPEIILAGRKINDGMGSYVIDNLLHSMSLKNIDVRSSNVLIMGLAFKENCSDFRNTKVVDIIDGLIDKVENIDCYDPWVDSAEVKKELKLDLVTTIKINFYDAVILAVAHDEFKMISRSEIRNMCKKNHLLFDLKWILPKNEVDFRL